MTIKLDSRGRVTSDRLRLNRRSDIVILNVSYQAQLDQLLLPDFWPKTGYSQLSDRFLLGTGLHFGAFSAIFG